MPSVEIGVCKENFIIPLQHRTPGRLLLNIPVSEEFHGKPGSFSDLPCPGSQSLVPEVWSYPSTLLFSLASELQGLSPVPAFCWPEHPLANPAENSSLSSVWVRRVQRWQKEGLKNTWLARMEQGRLLPFQGSLRTEWSKFNPSPKPPGSAGTSFGFRHLGFRAMVCLLPICKQSEDTALTHFAILRMMKNLGVKSHVSLVERNTCSGVSLNFKQVFPISAGLSPAVLP